MWPKNGISLVLTRRAAWIGAVVAGVVVAVKAEDRVVFKPINVGTSLYLGQMFNIDSSLHNAKNFNPTVTLPFTSFWMIQNATVNERLSFSLGIAGSFFYEFPETNDGGWTSGRRGGVGIAQAMGSYQFGDLEKPFLEISVGQQGYKYNPYAKNFGEYIFRSEAYPTTVRTGDWGAIDNAGAGIWGIALKAQLLDGLIKNDFIISMANERAPLHDVSLTNITSLHLGKVFQVGAGVMLSRLIQIDPAKSRPERTTTGYFTWNDADQARLDAYIDAQQEKDAGFLDASDDFKRREIQVVNGVETVVSSKDTALIAGKTYWAGSGRPLVKFVSEISKNDSVARRVGAGKYNDLEYIDSRTTFLMGRMAFDPKPLFGIEGALGPNDLVLYAEMAALGLNNYPIYYTELEQRMPIMVGFYLPTFKYLDYFTFEAEYMKNPYLNSDYSLGWFRQLQPKSLKGEAPAVPNIGDPYYDKLQPGISDINHTGDDFKWTVTAAKSFGVWSIAAQYGKDHYRPLTDWFRPSFTEAATTSDARYYMIRLMVNL